MIPTQHPFRLNQKLAFNRLPNISKNPSKTERWRHTPIDDLLSKYKSSQIVDQEFLHQDRPLMQSTQDHRFVFKNGICISGPIVDNAKMTYIHAFEEPFVQEIFSRYITPFFPFQNDLSTLNHLLFHDIFLIQVHKDMFNPIQLDFVFDQDFSPHHPVYPLIIIQCKEGRSASVIERHFETFQNKGWNNSVIYFILNTESQLKHVKIQKHSDQFIHSATENFYLEDRSSCHSSIFMFGGQRSIHENYVHIAGEHVDCTWNGLYLTNGEQISDIKTHVAHHGSCGKSSQNYKGIASEKAKVILKSGAAVDSNVQDVSVYQNNENFIASESSHVYILPSLEISSKEVQCNHGAIFNSFDNQVLFYLCTRGIALKDAKSMLLHGFIEDFLKNIHTNIIKKEVMDYVTDKIRKIQHT